MLSTVLAEIDGRHSIADALTQLLAMAIALQIRSKGCHWHVTGTEFRSLHSLFDEQAEDLADLADEIAERSRALGSPTVSSIGDVVNADAMALDPLESLEADGMLRDLRRSNMRLATAIKDVRKLSDETGDFVGVSLADGWLAATERRVWMLSSSMPQGRS